MPRIIDDVESDNVSYGKLARRALNSKMLNNTTIDRIEDETKDQQSYTRRDGDGGHRRDDAGKPANNNNSVFTEYRMDDRLNIKSSNNTNAGNFVNNVVGKAYE